ncbi:MAG: hypothetical protein JXR78_02700 [Victivallales bacterium]|nr:hypothetical protein [Victivallales bacterium]
MKFKQIFCLGSALLAGSFNCASGGGEDVIPPPMFQVFFNKGLDASIAGGNPQPLKSANITHSKNTDASNGGIYIPANGHLLYELDGNFPTEQGTLVMWVKFNRKLNGSGWRTLFDTVNNGEMRRRPSLRAMCGPWLHYAWYNDSSEKSWSGREISAWDSAVSRITPDKWECFAFTWNSTEGISFFLNGTECSRGGIPARSKRIFGPHGVRYISVSPEIMPQAGLDGANGFYLGSGFCASNRVTGMEGFLAEAVIYPKALTEKQLHQIYAERHPAALSMELLDFVSLTGVPAKLRLRLHNKTDRKIQQTCSFNFNDASGKQLSEDNQTITLLPGNSTIINIPFTAMHSGIYTLHVSDKTDSNIEKRLLKKYELFAIDRKPIYASMPLSNDGKTIDRLLETIDCTHEYPEKKFSTDGSQVVNTDHGSWREGTVRKLHSGFSYRLEPIKNPGRPHWLEIEYPDNLERAFYVAVFNAKKGQLYNSGLDTIGVITGGAFPVTGKILKKRLLFWPDSRDLVVECRYHYPYPRENPPALAKISIYEIEGNLPRLEVNVPADEAFRREIGVWNEDPSFFRREWFKKQFFVDDRYDSYTFWQEKWQRVISYMHYTGQNTWMMQAYDYFGDRTGLSESLPQGTPDGGSILGQIDLGAALLQREKLGFFLSIQDCYQRTFRGSSGLAKAMGTAHPAMTQKEAIARKENCTGRICGDGTYVIKADPLHPSTQQAMLKLLHNYAEKFVVWDSFRGIIILPTGSSLFYRNEIEGYSDYNISAFEKDSGISIPVPANLPDRSVRRYEWLMKNASTQWFKWRAEKLSSFYRQMAKTFSQIAPGRELIIFVGDGMDRYMFEKWPVTTLSDLREAWLRRGVDLDAITKIDNFRIQFGIAPYIERAGWQPHREKSMFNERYFQFWPQLPQLYPEVLISYHSNMELAPHPQHKEPLRPLFPKSENNVNRCYPTPLPPGSYSLAPLLRVMADYAPALLFHGWWGCPDNGVIAEMLPFYRAFRAIPTADFKNIPGLADPLRVKFAPDVNTLLLINRESYPVTLNMQLGKNCKSLNDLVENSTLELTDGNLRIEVQPYSMLCFRGGNQIQIGEFRTKVPPYVISELNAKLDKLKNAPETEKAKNGLNTVIRLAEEALKKGEYSHLAYLLQSGPAERILGRTTAFP